MYKRTLTCAILALLILAAHASPAVGSVLHWRAWIFSRSSPPSLPSLPSLPSPPSPPFPPSSWLFARTGEVDLLPQVRGMAQLAANVLYPQPRTAPDVPVAHAGVNPFGINVFLEQEVEEWKRERSLQMVAEAGFHWLRQEFPWEDIEIHGKRDFEDRRHEPYRSAWEKYDQIVDLAERYGLEIVPRLSNPPAWTRADGDARGTFAPPDDLADWGDYVYTVVSRYKGRVRYYQLWNEPNIYPEWGEQPVDPEGYTRLLCEGYRRAKEADADAVIISGALAPTVSLDPGPGPALGLSDFVFLQRMYDAGAAACFDVLSINDYMLWSGPTDHRMQPLNINFARPLYIRDIMVANGDAAKPIWISEMNSNAVPNDPAIQGWGAYGQVTLEQQARYAVLAYQRALEEWPWVGVINFWFFKRATDTERDQSWYYFRMVEPDFTPLPVYEAMKEYTAHLTPTLYPGTHQEDHWALAYQGDWETAQIGKSANQQVGESAGQAGSEMVAGTCRRAVTTGAVLHFWFEGTSLTLVPGSGAGVAEVRVDGGAPRRVWLDGRPVRLVRNWGQERHEVTLTAVSGEVSVDALIVHRPWHPFPWLVLVIPSALVLVLVVTASVVQRHTQHPTSNLQPPFSILLPLAILLLASFLRFYRLDAQSFWNDEGNSARIAERTVSLILEGAAGDIHPPGYYLLLHCWRALAGHSEFALRSLSVIAGLALVLFTYLLGRRLFGRTTGLLAALLAALSPFAIYYSQEARMYALLAALSAASTYLLVCLLTNCKSQISKSANQQIGRLPFAICHSPFAICYLLFAVCTAGLYTQYAFAFILLVHNAIFGLWWLAMARRSKDRWRWLAMWAGVQVAIVALYLPWLPVALRSVTGWPSAEGAPVLGRALLDVLRVLTVGVTLPLEEATAALVGAGLLLLLGLVSSPAGALLAQSDDLSSGGYAPRLNYSFSVAAIALYLLLPVALLFAFDLYKPAWLKFLVVVLPPFHILVARGIQNLAQFTRAQRQEARSKKQEARGALHLASCILLLGIYLTTTFQSLRNLYFDPAYARDDYRQIAADMAALARPGDGIVLNAPNQWEVFTYYYPDQDVHPAPYRPAPGEAEAFLAPLAGRYRRLFVLYWGDAESDPGRLVETWLAAHTYPTADRWYGRVRLATYAVAALPEEPAVALDACFGPQIRLRGYTLAGEQFAPGDVLPVTLFWETQAFVAERYKVTVQLLDGAGHLAAQRDAEPGAGLAPTTAWQPGQVIADHYGIPLPADLAPGRYTLIVGLYHIATGQRLSVMLGGEAAGDHLVLTSVEIWQ